MACLNCEHETKDKVIEEAKEMATRSGEWYGIYKDGQGNTQYIKISIATGYPIEQYISPVMRDASV